ncbi:hypothetical protein AGMMS49579_16600 [Spirochaetia bacterium]|nr:hypothetical protein AGMMS49579_16600 [Spirochaetia bacterium]
MEINQDKSQKYLEKWQKILRLLDWDIKIKIIDIEWRKTGDIKIDETDRTAILLLNGYNPKQTNLEEVIIHELLHLKLYGMDQMIEELIGCVYGKDENDSKRSFAYSHFMTILETTVNDLAKSFLIESGENKEISFGRIEKEIENDMKEEK